MAKTRWESYPGNVVSKVVEADGREVRREWYARVRYRGRERRFEAESEQDAREKATFHRHEIKRAKYLGQEWAPPEERKRAAAARKYTFAKFADKFLEDWTSSLSENTRNSYRRQLAHAKQRLGRKRLEDISVADVQSFYAARLKKVKVSTANVTLRVLKTCLERAVEWDYLEKNVAKRVKYRTEPEREDRYLHREEAERLFAHAGDLRPMLEVAAYTGLRQGELCSLKWSQVSLKQRTIRLRGTGTKNKRGRTVPLSRRPLEVLTQLHASRAAGGHVFHWRGRPVTKGTIDEQFPRIRKRAEVEDFRFHDLRHTAASWLVMAGVDLYEVQKILGHASYAMVQRYAHLAPGHLQSAASKLDTFEAPSESDVVSNVVSMSDAANEV
jgi:integrase